MISVRGTLMLTIMSIQLFNIKSFQRIITFPSVRTSIISSSRINSMERPKYYYYYYYESLKRLTNNRLFASTASTVDSSTTTEDDVATTTSTEKDTSIYVQEAESLTKIKSKFSLFSIFQV